MQQIDLRKIYRFYPLDPAPGPDALPSAGDLYYECLECAVILNSVPRAQVACNCGNLSGNDGKIEVKNPERVRVVRGRLK
ncbi:MAG: hypothetical protein BWY57_00424 [Betaproteobacteria bacterium ADurb.Bin341]|nr:MAG: hypothetical protein BWY57_00424 [Betaproteobacteria bacterium ADurb.Bin341]